MSKFNTISLDAADTLFYIKKGLGDTYNGVLKKYADNYDSKNISASFKKHFSNRKGLSFQGLSGINCILLKEIMALFSERYVF